MDKIAVFSADERYKYTKEILQTYGYDVNLYSDTDDYKGEKTIVFPLPVTRNGLVFYLPLAKGQRYIIPFIDTLDPKVRLFGGALKHGFYELCRFYGHEITDYYDDEMQSANSVLTADAAFKLYGGKKVLVIGFGKIGKRLASLAPNASVCARSEADVAEIKAKYSFLAYDELESEISGFDVIYNTVPAPVVGQKAAENVRGRFIELASKPGGIETGAELNCKYIVKRGLPAEAEPEKAGELIARSLKKLL